MKILVMGLPGSGKTTFADKLKKWAVGEGYTVERINADKVRAESNDWDFSECGRLRQAERLGMIADVSTAQVTITDFVAGLPKQREIFNADYVVFMDTIEQSRYEDTNKVFERPSNADMVVTNWS